jgi:hypothetical protein
MHGRELFQSRCDLKLVLTYILRCKPTIKDHGTQSSTMSAMLEPSATASFTVLWKACDVTAFPTWHASHNRRKRGGGVSRQKSRPRENLDLTDWDRVS